MKAISVRQPWAYFILTGQKPIENRTWSTNYRGPLVIHSGLRVGKNYNEVLVPTARELGPAVFLEAAVGASPKCTLTTACRRGCLLGIVDLVSVCEESTSPWFQGPYGWVLINPILFPEPIPYKGRLGLFNVPDALLEGVL